MKSTNDLTDKILKSLNEGLALVKSEKYIRPVEDLKIQKKIFLAKYMTKIQRYLYMIDS